MPTPFTADLDSYKAAAVKKAIFLPLPRIEKFELFLVNVLVIFNSNRI